MRYDPAKHNRRYDNYSDKFAHLLISKMVTSKPVILNLKNVGLSDEQFYQLCQTNENWRIEQTAQGKLLIMPPVGAISGNRESEFNADVVIWNRQTKLVVCQF